MDLDTWWGVIERARTVVGDRADDRDLPDDPIWLAVVELLAALDPPEIITFEFRFIEVSRSAYRWPLWGAAFLIEGGCGDGGFMDFRAGLVLLGRDTFARAVADPDSLADLPVVQRMARDSVGWIGCEEMNYAAKTAYRHRLGETNSFDAAISPLERLKEPTGESWDFEDDDENRRRLPRLGALFL